MTGFLALAAAALLVAALALALRWKNGRFAGVQSREDEGAEALTAEEIGAELGSEATLVQFSSAFCAPCRATRILLADVARTQNGVVAVDIDAESHLELVRRLGVLRTPTVFVLDARGSVVTRASGLPRREQVVLALQAARS